ncbi:MAG: hypothetical protein ACOH1Q_07145 [Thiobacillus sp.]
MGGIVAKLARGTARLAFWRKPDEASPDTAAPAAASASNTAPTADAPKPSWFAHLKQKLQRGVESVAAAPEPSAASVSNTAPTADAPKPSWFAHLKQKLRRGEEPAAAAPEPAAARALIAAPAADDIKPSWIARLKQKLRRSEESTAPVSVAATVQAVIPPPAPPPVMAPPPPAPPMVSQQLEEMLELSDPVAPLADADRLFGDDTPVAEIDALASSEIVQADFADADMLFGDDTPIVADSLAAEMELPELEPETADTALDPLAELPQAQATSNAAAVTASPTAEAALEEGDESRKPKLLSRLLGTLTKKWVWIPSVSVAMLAVMGTLSFMLMQSKQATHELQAQLATAKKQLKQVPVKPQVVPPLLVAHQDVTPHGVNAAAASPNDAPYDEASTQAAADSSPGLNMDMDCDISDKASVAKNLRNCIEAYNQATAR